MEQEDPFEDFEQILATSARPLHRPRTAGLSRAALQLSSGAARKSGREHELREADRQQQQADDQAEMGRLEAELRLASVGGGKLASGSDTLDRALQQLETLSEVSEELSAEWDEREESPQQLEGQNNDEQAISMSDNNTVEEATSLAELADLHALDLASELSDEPKEEEEADVGQDKSSVGAASSSGDLAQAAQEGALNGQATDGGPKWARDGRPGQTEWVEPGGPDADERDGRRGGGPREGGHARGASIRHGGEDEDEEEKEGPARWARSSESEGAEGATSGGVAGRAPETRVRAGKTSSERTADQWRPESEAEGDQIGMLLVGRPSSKGAPFGAVQVAAGRKLEGERWRQFGSEQDEEEGENSDDKLLDRQRRQTGWLKNELPAGQTRAKAPSGRPADRPSELLAGKQQLNNNKSARPLGPPSASQRSPADRRRAPSASGGRQVGQQETRSTSWASSWAHGGLANEAVQSNLIKRQLVSRNEQKCRPKQEPNGQEHEQFQQRVAGGQGAQRELGSSRVGRLERLEAKERPSEQEEEEEEGERANKVGGYKNGLNNPSLRRLGREDGRPFDNSISVQRKHHQSPMDSQRRQGDRLDEQPDPKVWPVESECGEPVGEAREARLRRPLRSAGCRKIFANKRRRLKNEHSSRRRRRRAKHRDAPHDEQTDDGLCGWPPEVGEIAHSILEIFKRSLGEQAGRPVGGERRAESLGQTEGRRAGGERGARGGRECGSAGEEGEEAAEGNPVRGATEGSQRGESKTAGAEAEAEAELRVGEGALGGAALALGGSPLAARQTAGDEFYKLKSYYENRLQELNWQIEWIGSELASESGTELAADGRRGPTTVVWSQSGGCLLDGATGGLSAGELEGELGGESGRHLHGGASACAAPPPRAQGLHLSAAGPLGATVAPLGQPLSSPWPRRNFNLPSKVDIRTGQTLDLGLKFSLLLDEIRRATSQLNAKHRQLALSKN